MTAHPRLWRVVWLLPRVDAIPAFMFFTSGAPEVPLVGYSQPIRYPLALKGLPVHDSFSCRGLDTFGPICLVGGVNKGRPNDRDLERTAAFPTRQRERIARPEPAA